MTILKTYLPFFYMHFKNGVHFGALSFFCQVIKCLVISLFKMNTSEILDSYPNQNILNCVNRVILMVTIQNYLC